MKEFKLLMTAILFLVAAGIASAQRVAISGTVTDGNGAPLPGAAVYVDGTTVGTLTDADGGYALSVPQDAQLTVSLLGYKTQSVPVNGRKVVNVVLEDDAEVLGDAIVVAFGTTTREAFTGSATVVKSEELQKRTVANVQNALVGTVTGLQMRGSTGQPGSTGTINIRGLSIPNSASTSPLVIVDGAPYSASLSNIAQNDIESVTVLKDAASAALYGARGAAGVIIITTKKGNANNAAINFDMKFGVNSRALQTYDVITDPGEYYEAYYAQLYNQGYYGRGYTAEAADAYANAKLLTDLQYQAFTVPDGQNLIVNGKLNPKATLGYAYDGGDGYTYYITPDNYLDEAYRTSLRQEYNLNVTGGSDKGSYYMSLGYLDEDGIVPMSNYKRISARIKTDYAVRKWLTVGANVGYAHSASQSNAGSGTSLYANNIFNFASRIAPIFPIYVRVLDASGNPVIKTDEHGNQAYDYGTNYPGLSRPYLATGNPLGQNQYSITTSEGNQLNATGNASVKFTDFLSLNITSTVTWGNTQALDFGNMFYGSEAGAGGSVGRSSTNSLRTNNVQTLNYGDAFGLHHVNAVLGHEYYDTQTKYLDAVGKGLFSNDIKEINATALRNEAHSYTSRYNVEGYFLSANYDYDNKYYASASFRRDATSYFAKDHRWGNFWSVGAAWIVSKENFMQNATWLDVFKLKASIGQQGNDSIGAYNYIDLYNLVKASDTSMTVTFAQKGNSNISWETTTNFNVGTEFSLWKGRLSGELNVYDKLTKDLLFWVSIPESSGTRGMYDNIGDVRNYGVELSLTAGLVRTRDISWDVFGNISHNRSKILSLPESKLVDDEGEIGDGYNEGNYWYGIGKELYNYYNAVYAGVDEYGQAMFYIDTVDENGNKVEKGGTTYSYNDATYYEHGSILPKFFGGFGTNFRFKDFDASVVFDYQIGGKVYDGYYASIIGPTEAASSNSGTVFHRDWKKSWSPDNTSSDMPRWQYGDQYGAASSDRFLTDAGYLNFQSFTVGYNFPEKLLRATKVVKRARIYVAGENLYFWSARKGLDPRYSYGGNSSVLNYSPARTISGGIQLTF